MLRECLKKYKKHEIVLLLLVIVQIVYLMVFNILHTKYIINFDSSEYMVQVIQIWKQKTLLIEDYYYSTMLTWDMPTLIAVLFYGIFKDVFLAYGLANNVLIICFVLMLNKLCNDLEYSKTGKYLAFLAIFTVYQHGMVDYIEELFVNGALYGFRILFMLMLVDVLVCLHKNVVLKRNIVIYVFSLIGFFICGISSGIFELGCCILPLFLFEVWDVLCKSEKIKIIDFFNIKVILTAISAISCVGGVVVNYLLGFNGSSAASKTTVAASEMAKNISGIFVGFFQLFGWTDSNIVITSLEGIMAFVAFFVACVVIVTFVLSARIAFKKVENEGVIPVQRKYAQMVMCVFIVNILLFCLADLTYGSTTFEYRYWLMIVVPVFIELGLVYDWANKNVSYNYRTMIVLVYVTLLCLINGYKDTELWDVNEGAANYETAMKVADERDLNTIFIYGDYFCSRECAAFAKEDMEVFAIGHHSIDDDGSGWIIYDFRMPRWGTYVKYDGDCMEMDVKENIGVFILNDEVVCPDYKLIASKAVEIIPVEGSFFDVMIMDANYIDFVYGLPRVGYSHSRDYFNWGYDREGFSFNEDGNYQSNGSKGTILEGEFTAAETGTYSAVLQYEILSGKDTEPAVLNFVVTDPSQNTYEYKCDILTGQSEVSIENISIQEGDTYTVSVVEKDGTVLVLKQIDFYKQP